MIYEVSFTEDKEIDIKIILSYENIIECKLVFRKGGRPYISFGAMLDLKISGILHRQLSKSENILSCGCGYQELVLVNSKYNNSVIYPEFVYFSDDVDTVKGLSISIPGLYEYFNGPNSFEFTDGYLRKEIKNSFLELNFNIGNDRYRLNVEHHAKTEGNSIENKVVIIQDAVVNVTKVDGFIQLEFAREISKIITGLFSLLLGFKLSINKIWLFDSECHTGLPFYFLSDSEKEMPFDHWINTFTKFNTLNVQDWEIIIERAFSDEYQSDFEKFWVRIIQLYSYKGFWEYETLGVFSTLEAYFSYIVAQPNIKDDFKVYLESIQDDKNSTLSKIISLQEKFNNKKTLTKMEAHIFKTVKLIVGTSKPRATHGQKYDYVMANFIPKEVSSILSISTDDIDTIKLVRVAAAHALPLDGSVRDLYQKIKVIRSKFMMLLHYLAFKGLGITDEKFAEILVHNNYLRKKEANLNEFHINVLLRYEYIYKVEENELIDISLLKGDNLIFVYDSGTKIVNYIDEQFNVLMTKWRALNESEMLVTSRDLESFIYENYICVSEFLVNVVSYVYFHSDDENIRINNAIIITLK
ncbi:MAG: hypothetical protein P4L95_11840 [Rouxiella aceris]|uniref:hypothetical protein n=1 Tax=Rouxiella aceris TaxID=2703884 RepID=UPI0028521A63|nr:hypothetical protein [Rouxiella aceris]MDR3432573.1 hypothetical protein [Rouxiella aceris]